MAVYLLNPSRKTLLSFTSHLFSRLPLVSLFSTNCRKSYGDLEYPTVKPQAKKVPFTASAHGVTWKDPYRWMSDTSDPDFVTYINQENAYAEMFASDAHELQRILYSEMVSRIPENIVTPPEKCGPWLYYQCIPEGKEYPVLYRKSAVKTKGWLNSVVDSFKGSEREQVLLDWNEIAEKHGYVHVGTCRVSPDHNFLAYTIDATGNELFKLQIKDLRVNSILTQPSAEGVVSLAWAQDSLTLFYTLCDQNQRPDRVMCTRLGPGSKDDSILILTEDDSRFCIDITSTKDGKFVTVNSNSRTSSEVYVINAANPTSGLQRFCRRISGIQYFLEHHGDFFYVLTNEPLDDSKNFSGVGYYLARCRDEDAQSSKLQSVIVPGEDTCFEDMDMFDDHLVLFLNKRGTPSICSIDMPIRLECENKKEIDDLNPWYFPLPPTMCTVAPASNHDFMSTKYRAVLSSPVMPDLIVDYDMSNKNFSILGQEDVRNLQQVDSESASANGMIFLRSEEEAGTSNNINDKWNDFSEKYTCEEKEVISHDGARIPLTVLFSKSAYRKGQSPGLIHGYGAYGESLEKNWCSDRLSLLDRGWLLAFADVRGGAGPDPSWHNSGRGLNKLNSIHDFVSCGEYLISERFVHKNQLSAFGISAGCLLVGAAINLRPELFRAAILKVPFVDVLNTLLDPTLPLTTLDYEEFGDPQILSYFEYIRRYSPYDNITPGFCYPSMLVSASFNDSRVGVWEAVKWVAKIRDTTCATCSSSVILRTNLDSGGHFGEGGRYAHCLETAYDYAFLIKVTERDL